MSVLIIMVCFPGFALLDVRNSTVWLTGSITVTAPIEMPDATLTVVVTCTKWLLAPVSLIVMVWLSGAMEQAYAAGAARVGHRGLSSPLF